jgi:hypothetical protein
MFDPLAQMIPVLKSPGLGRAKQLDHRRFSLRMALHVCPDHDICRARQRQHLGYTLQHMRGGHTVVHLDLEEVLGANGGAVLFGDLVGEATQGEASNVPRLFDQVSPL